MKLSWPKTNANTDLQRWMIKAPISCSRHITRSILIWRQTRVSQKAICTACEAIICHCFIYYLKPFQMCVTALTTLWFHSSQLRFQRTIPLSRTKLISETMVTERLKYDITSLQSSLLRSLLKAIDTAAQGKSLCYLQPSNQTWLG